MQSVLIGSEYPVMDTLLFYFPQSSYCNLFRGVAECYVVFEHGPFDYDQECRTVEEKVEAAMKAFDYGPTGRFLDTTPGRIMYLYFNPGQYFKYIRPIRRLERI